MAGAEESWREAFPEVPTDELDAPGLWSDPNFSLSKSANIGKFLEGIGERERESREKEKERSRERSQFRRVRPRRGGLQAPAAAAAAAARK